MKETQDPLPDARPANHTRRRVLVALASVFILVGAGTGLWWWLDGQWEESSNDAYVQGNVVPLTPQIGGVVVRLNADDTALVHAGEPVVELDRADAETALAQAEAALAQAARRVRQLFANADAQRANVALRQAELDRAREDLARRTGLPDSRAVSREELSHAQAEVRTAAAALQAAEQELAASEVLIANTTIRNHPEVAQAAAQLRAAYLAAHRTSVIAPVTGYIAERSVQVGQQLAAGTPLLAIVPLTDLWVDANLKETQLVHVRIGQPVTLWADVYGGEVVYHGRVVGLGAGTGSAFELLPPQNATGNWIKIVQRLPVRIALDPREVAEHPLRVGLSMEVEIDTHDRSGLVLAEVPPAQPAAVTSVYDGVLAAGDLLAREIVDTNIGEPSLAINQSHLGSK